MSRALSSCSQPISTAGHVLSKVLTSLTLFTRGRNVALQSGRSDECPSLLCIDGLSPPERGLLLLSKFPFWLIKRGHLYDVYLP